MEISALNRIQKRAQKLQYEWATGDNADEKLIKRTRTYAIAYINFRLAILKALEEFENQDW